MPFDPCRVLWRTERLTGKVERVNNVNKRENIGDRPHTKPKSNNELRSREVNSFFAIQGAEISKTPPSRTLYHRSGIVRRRFIAGLPEAGFQLQNPAGCHSHSQSRGTQERPTSVRLLLFTSSPGGVVIESHALDQERRLDVIMVHCRHASFTRVERTNVPLTANRNSLS